MTNKDERNRFEQWFEAANMPMESGWFERDADGDYEFGPTCNAWAGWQAALRRLAATGDKT